MASIDLSEITKRFTSGGNTHLAVDNLDLTINDGEFVSLVGPSGCGKSTTLRMIAGLEAPDLGRIQIGGKDVTHTPPQRRNLSMVFQNYAIFPHMTVRQNIGYGLRIAGTPRDQREARVREVARLVDIEGLLDRLPRQLSGGQRQRVAVARAFARNPAIVLMDEPLSNLDAKLRDQTRTELKQLHQRVKHTMIYVTHDQLEALTLSDRIAVMNNGMLQQYATPSTVFNQPANLFVATFIGSPTMNTFPATMAHSGEQGRISCLNGWDAVIDGIAADGGAPRPVLIGIRPKDLVMSESQKPGAMPTTITLIEPIGSEAIVHLDMNGKPLIVQSDSSPDMKAGDTVYLEFPADRLHVFDAESGTAIYHGSAKRYASRREAVA